MKNNNKNRLKDYAKYSSIALQMGLIITAGGFAGYYLDKFINIKFPVFTILFLTISVILAIYIIIKDLLK